MELSALIVAAQLTICALVQHTICAMIILRKFARLSDAELILTAANNFYAMQKLERNKMRLEEQLTALKDYNERISDNQKRVSVMRHDLRHSYNLIYAMLESGNVAKAREHILKQEQSLEEKSD